MTMSCKTPCVAPVQVEWLPWHHTMGSNVILHGILKHGGTLYIDEGRPVPQLFHKTIANLKEVSPTAMFNVPAGYTLLCEALETDQDLRANFFRQLTDVRLELRDLLIGADLFEDFRQPLTFLAVIFADRLFNLRRVRHDQLDFLADRKTKFINHGWIERIGQGDLEGGPVHTHRQTLVHLGGFRRHGFQNFLGKLPVGQVHDFGSEVIGSSSWQTVTDTFTYTGTTEGLTIYLRAVNAGSSERAGFDRVIDFRRSNLHVVSYSRPVRARLGLAELKAHLHTLPEHPDWIPYRTTYYSEGWGFCLSHRQFLSLADDEYEVCIDASLEPGHLSYGESVLPGETDEEIAHVTGYTVPMIRAVLRSQ
jgi:hypothetical protein